ncbi:LPXTG cell wall anchor domain-containing protein [Cryptosporangium aurantiacum]|nr:LPXTG cell wall anchor domain-containing protein [Cryptosporangium aurantiacum]
MSTVAQVERVSYQARASASVLRLADSDAGPRGTALSGLRLGTTTARVDTDEPPRSAASAVQMTGPPGAPPAAVTRSAGDGDEESGTMTRTSSGADLDFLTLGSSRLTANAQWGSGTVLSSAIARPGELVLRPDEDAPLMHVWRGSQSRTQNQLVAVPGQPTLGMRSSARTELTAITLFRGTPTEVTIRFLTAPSLVALAAGTDRTDVRYAAPVISVTATHGRSYRLDTVGDSVEVPLAEPGCCSGGGLIRISLGGVRERTGHTSVDASAAAVRLQLLGAEGAGRLLDATIGDLDVSARVPMGGLDAPCRTCADPDPEPGTPEPEAESDAAAPDAGNTPDSVEPAEPAASANVAAPSEQPAAGPALPLTGASLSVLAALGMALIGTGWFIIRVTRRRRRRSPLEQRHH